MPDFNSPSIQDVYKRQAYTVDELEALYGSGTKELIESLINAELLSVTVSYTHLDVYKRQ